ncbi:MAG: ABC transporter permease [Chloroflexi bacterium]|nr:ABC transporter permease [Chloroflexota bacterium]
MESDAILGPSAAAPGARIWRSTILRVRQRGLDVVWPVAVGALVITLWEWGVRAFGVREVLLPSPLVIATTAVQKRDLLLQHTWPTVSLTIGGFVLAVVIGVSLGVLFSYSRFFRIGVYPYVVMLQIIPKIALAPLFVIWFGLSDTSRLAIAFFISFFPVVVNTATGLNGVDPDLVRMGRAFSGSKQDIFLKIRFPHALPYIFAGMKVAMTLSIIGIIVAEFVTAQQGLGYLIIFATALVDTPMVMASIAVLSVAGLALYGIVSLAEGLVLYWKARN